MLFLARANLSRLKKNHLDGPADLAVEIISPESEACDRETKFAEYEQGGVSEYWLLHPETHEHHFYQRDAAGKYVEIPVSAEGIYTSRELSGFRLNIAWLLERLSLREIFRTWDTK